MANDLSLSKAIPHPVTEDDAKAALLKAAARIGKASVTKDGYVVVRPRTSIHRLKMRTETDLNRSGSQVVTYSGTIGLSLFMGTVGVVFVLMMMLTIIGIVVAFFAVTSSRKVASEAFKDVSGNAIEALT